MFRRFHRFRRACRSTLSRWLNYARWRYFETVHSTAKWFRSLRRVSQATAAEIEGDLKRRPSLKFRNFVNPVFWLLQSLSFGLRYLSSRCASDLLAAIPAVLGVAAPIICQTWLSPDSQEVISRARVQLQRHLQQKEFAEAEFYASLWCSVSRDADEAVFEKAGVLELAGKEREARLLLELLDQRRGYIPALARICIMDLGLARETRGEDAQVLKRLEPALLRLNRLQPGNPGHALMLGTFYMISRRDAQALPVLQRVTASAINLPEAWYSLAIVRTRMGQPAEAMDAANMAANLYLQRNAEQGYTLESTLQIVRALLLAQREQQALTIAQSALMGASESDRRVLLTVIAEICASWAARIRQTPTRSEAELATAVQVLAQGLEASPDNALILDELSQFGVQAAPKDVEVILKGLLDSGVEPGLVHFILGTRAIRATPPDERIAIQHFRLAMEHNARYPGVLNNLADSIANSDSGNYEEGLTLVNQALLMIPDQPYFHDTRGKLHVKLGNFISAIADFERAMRAEELRPAVRKRIAAAEALLNAGKKPE